MTDECPNCESEGIRENTSAKVYTCPNMTCRVDRFRHTPIDQAGNSGMPDEEA